MDIKKYFIQLDKDAHDISPRSPASSIDHDYQPIDIDSSLLTDSHDLSRPNPLDGSDEDCSGIDEESLYSETMMHSNFIGKQW